MDWEGANQEKQTLLQSRDPQASLEFAAVHMDKPNAFWRKILWSDSTASWHITMTQTHQSWFWSSGMAFPSAKP